MEERDKTKPRHKEWRRIAKKERRRRIRRKAAQERDGNEEKLMAALMSNMEYLNWRAEQERLEEEKEIREQEEHAEQNRLWLEEEARAQKEWQVLQEQKAREEQQRLEQQMKIRKEFELRQEAIQKQKEEEKRKLEEQFRKQQQLQKEIDDYIDNGMKTPEALREIIDNQPSKDICPFFMKTGVCRYGDMCSKNHRRVFLSKVILIPGFYTHFSLEKNSAEYDTDIGLEFENSETWHHFRKFYEDVIKILELFGKIKTLKCCCNTELHLRGNLYVEYYTEREAARAWRHLKGYTYANKQLNCEFVNLTSWRKAICGMTKCPKGSKACNFLHTFRNPHDEYGIRSPPRNAENNIQESNNSKRSERSKSRWEESVRDDNEKDRNWRWQSESPEKIYDETNDRSQDSKRKRSHSTERKSRKSVRNKRYSQAKRSSSSRRRTSFDKHRSSRSKKIYDDEDHQDKEEKSDRNSSQRHEKESRKRKSDSENGYKTSRRKY
ncbi:U2 small nuclear ribonucleoprotein auxiliary factor 35 kDa subunit-related protein 2 [Camponotus floridanus]|uniref:U2 small nuclear ribonucleoprotein auxiliary factor 35 kDa subunit-related protein 2 n=1 Tax=Camponotus floridanus TaxID=104421 RepID=UPI000DC69F26|nr:U2 small nuclear ribonucleoprotein auxiliary factor 35 kDa subunit-related protein 2 [Camponotus floridanus]